ncbi:MAG: BCCT family transporter [Alphaproteobacteria bacterium]|nr:BCCT family transporter [Alphaproteobacteria bacterium]
MEPAVFFGAALVVIAFVAFGSTFTEIAADWFGAAQSWISEHLGWYYVLTATGFLVFCIWLMASPFGRIRLGADTDRPQFTRLSWFTMLFSAGMGTGLVFWGVAEPIMHYGDPPFGAGETGDALRVAVRYSFFHWGLHPWAIYSILGLALAYFHFRKKFPLRPRSILHPLIGDRIDGPIGHFVDILCTVGTLLGVGTSLGLGAMQVNSGLAASAGAPETVSIQLFIIIGITIVATISVVSGVHHGIRRLSRFNIMLAAAILVFVLVVGPTVYILETLVGGLGYYIQHLPQMSLRLELGRDTEWQANWTLFYWGWWISWSPFVGIFIARISKGRTIREFVISVLLVPTLVTFVWLSVFGGTALYFEHFGAGGLSGAIQDNPARSLHMLLDDLPFGAITAILATLLIAVFFITSSDSGSLVDDMVTSGGHPNPPTSQRVFWAVSEGAVAATLLVAGGLQAIQSAAISAGLPMSVLLIVACIALMRALRSEAVAHRRRAETAP